MNIDGRALVAAFMEALLRSVAFWRGYFFGAKGAPEGSPRARGAARGFEDGQRWGGRLPFIARIDNAIYDARRRVSNAWADLRGR